MAQKIAPPNNVQSKVIKQNGLKPTFWIVMEELDHHLILMHRFKKIFRTVCK